jgi:FdhD protein
MTQPTTSLKVKAVQLSGGQFSPIETGVIIEKELAVYLNGARLATASMAPGMEKEFAAGYLFGQGFIEGITDIKSIAIENGTAQVVLKDNKTSPAGATDYRIVSGGGRSAYFKESGIKQIKSDLTIDKRNIFKAMNTLFQSSSLYGETEGAHAAGLFNAAAEPICIVEDIGRHNTLDKIIGFTMLYKTDTSKVFLVSTGRMASEMVTKICRSGIPIAATKTAVTDKGLEIAKKCGLTLIGFVRDTGNKINTDMDVRVIKESGMKIYTGAERIHCE